MSERLQVKYKEEILPELVKELKLENSMSAPSIKKVSVNAGIGEFRESHDAVEAFKEEMTALLGQAPQERPAKKAISGFKLQKGDIVGISATLRGDKMWAFIDKLVNIVLPRVRDFRGLETTAFDEHGNYSIGLDDHTIFPEVNPNKVKESRPMQINIVTSAETKEASELLLRKLGFPLKKEK
ncbi:50S ribosomal protein L5 [candidate division WWE3 bacterium]|nr:50S ribosomal protein L5 [candidate division WWE3 bacterium]